MKQTVTSYIVRIYNNDGTEPKRLVGMVEKVGIERWRKAVTSHIILPKSFTLN